MHIFVTCMFNALAFIIATIISCEINETAVRPPSSRSRYFQVECKFRRLKPFKDRIVGWLPCYLSTRLNNINSRGKAIGFSWRLIFKHTPHATLYVASILYCIVVYWNDVIEAHHYLVVLSESIFAHKTWASQSRWVGLTAIHVDEILF